jgi:hypothetical protein
MAFAFRELDMTCSDFRKMAWLQSTVYINPDMPVENLYSDIEDIFLLQPK